MTAAADSAAADAGVCDFSPADVYACLLEQIGFHTMRIFLQSFLSLIPVFFLPILIHAFYLLYIQC
jgi:hypothetical protein